MSGNSRFGINNLLNTTCTIQNGTGGAPAVEQYSADFPMTNLLQNDRLILWKTSVGVAFPLTVDISFSGNRTINAVGLHGIRPASGSSLTSMNIATQTGAYAPAGVWISQGTITGLTSLRDCGLAFASLTCRSLRITFGGVGQFQSGKLYAGLLTDLGRVGDLGLENSPEQNALITSLPGGSTFLHFLGDGGSAINMSFTNISKADSDTIITLASLSAAFIHVDGDDTFYDVIIHDKRISRKRTGGTLRSVALSLAVLP